MEVVTEYLNEELAVLYVRNGDMKLEITLEDNNDYTVFVSAPIGGGVRANLPIATGNLQEEVDKGA